MTDHNIECFCVRRPDGTYTVTVLWKNISTKELANKIGEEIRQSLLASGMLENTDMIQ